MSDKSIRDEVAELAEAVRDLKDREVADTLRDLRAEVELLRAERGTHHCVGCKCMHIHWYQQTYPIPGCAPVYPQVWYGTVTSGTSTLTTTNVAAGGNSTYTLGISN